MGKSFPQFFQQATGYAPYPYQEEFVNAESLPHLIKAPTSAGKTATAILGWLWRWTTNPQSTPRRLVYCLPMRVLVEQSHRVTERWLNKLGLSQEVGLHLLMGGEELDKWYLRPEQPAILIGTQDMLLSRALNRGYAASRFHWPIDFGLLNNDCLWIYDEPQLMGNGVATSAQLAGLRQSLRTLGDCPSIWMSATLDPRWLDTIDFRDKFTAPALELSSKDFAAGPLQKRMFAEKTLTRLAATSSKDMKDVAKCVLQLHGENSKSQTLVIVNTVERAKAIYAAIQKGIKKGPATQLLLVHSRFRPHEREALNQQLQPLSAEAGDGDCSSQEREALNQQLQPTAGEAIMNRIVVATQVVEAGVDISARTLITELAPWSSVVQRLGRCNRTGNDSPGQAYWIDLDEKLYPPYEADQLQFARRHLSELEGQGVSPRELLDYQQKRESPDGTGERFMPFEHQHVLRNRDLLDLFDTAPDLSGNDIDISRFIRSDEEERNVQVFWRDWTGKTPPADSPAPDRRELCRVPVGDFGKFLEAMGEKKRGDAWIWDHLEGKWVKLDKNRLRPGLVILLPVAAGGYSSELGWELTSTQTVEPANPQVRPRPPEEVGSDHDSTHNLPCALTIAEHTDNVCRQLAAFFEPSASALIGQVALHPVEPFRKTLDLAARWHDTGKAHDVFQQAVRRINVDLPEGTLYAKSGKRGRLDYKGQGRPHFRHELASALAAIQQELPCLTAYLIAAHHGRVRLSIRSLPGESPPQDDERKLFALGIQQHDPLGEVDLGGGVKSAAVELDLTPMQLGGDASWTGRVLELLQQHGPFVLAYLEAILRAADVGASMKEAGHAPG